MERITISLEEDLLAAFDELVGRAGYENRSEAVRDLVRHRLEEERLAGDPSARALACVSYVYNHHQRELARRLTGAQHLHHHLTLSTLHVHLDDENCLEVMLLQGAADSVRDFAQATIAQRGVRHGNIHMVPSDLSAPSHRHDHG